MPPLDGLDFVIAMGGPMSIHDQDTLSWLRPEKQFLRDVMARGIPVLGVCLGAQLIAAALGARVYRNPYKEIGWFPIESTAHAPGLFAFPERCTVFHWHGETFDLPPGAVRLARSTGCANQAFAVGPKVLGLQFHLETTPGILQTLIENCRDELVPGPYVQSVEVLEATPETAYADNNRLMNDVLAFLTRSEA